MKCAPLLPLTLLVSTVAFAQLAIEVGPGGVRVDPGGPREERIVREEGPCTITIIRRFNPEPGRRTVRRIRECDDDDEIIPE